jgi:hypothetical protein
MASIAVSTPTKLINPMAINAIVSPDLTLDWRRLFMLSLKAKGKSVCKVLIIYRERYNNNNSIKLLWYKG